jgi:hypothetical protein
MVQKQIRSTGVANSAQILPENDDISLTSTVPSDTEGEYVVDRILAEVETIKGSCYLVLWEGYGLMSSTWEYEDSFNSTAILEEWNIQKSLQDKGLEDEFDIEKFEVKRKQIMQEKGRRQKRRRAKRLYLERLAKGLPTQTSSNPSPHLSRAANTHDSSRKKQKQLETEGLPESLVTEARAMKSKRERYTDEDEVAIRAAEYELNMRSNHRRNASREFKDMVSVANETEFLSLLEAEVPRQSLKERKQNEAKQITKSRKERKERSRYSPSTAMEDTTLLILSSSLFVNNPLGALKVLEWLLIKIKTGVPRAWRLLSRPDLRNWLFHNFISAADSSLAEEEVNALGKLPYLIDDILRDEINQQMDPGWEAIDKSRSMLISPSEGSGELQDLLEWAVLETKVFQDHRRYICILNESTPPQFGQDCVEFYTTNGFLEEMEAKTQKE